MYQPKDRPPPKRRDDGVVHHALAFNTLLSSQETDAYSPTCERRTFRFLFSLCLYLFSRPARCQIDPTRSDLLE